MQIGCLAVIGLILGGMFGAAAGVGLGLGYTKIFHVSDREGYAGMLVFLTFMPLGAILGGIGGAIGLGLLAAKKPAGPPSDSDKIQ